LRLISLELHGFKSFADAQKLGFPGGMTAVVGPNGCGKSNISDALAWVLGEQRATLLRGSEMMDVIFSGTSQRKATGMAEVKLTLEMADPALAGGTKEVVISRRLYRDSGGEYRINGKECRLKDIQDLLLDTGMGTRAYSFIQQGQIDLILSSKPKDRRSLLEEAAGITRFKLRRQEAERRLEDTRTNLQRLDDILFELNKQLDSLKRQAAKARRAQELDLAIKETQRILLAGKTLELEAAKDRIVDQMEGLERQIASLTAQSSERASEVEHHRHRLDELRMGQDRRQRTILGLDQRLSLLEQDTAFQNQRIAEALEQAELLLQRREEMASRTGDAEAERERLEQAGQAAQVRLEGQEQVVSEAEEAVALASGALRHQEAGLRELRARRAEAEKAALVIQRQRQAIHQQVAQLEGRLEALNHEESVRAPRLEGLQADERRLAAELEGATERAEEMAEAVQVQDRLLREAQEAQGRSQKALREAEAALAAEEGRLRSLSDQLRKASGGEAQQKALAWLRERGEEAQALVDCLEVDEEARPDLERLLGHWLDTLNVGEQVDLAAIPGQLYLNLATPSENPDSPENARCLGLAIRWKAGKPRLLEALINRSFRCEDAQLPILAQAYPSLAWVSPSLVRLPYGPIQAGVHAPEASPLKLKAELEASRRQREGYLDQVEGLETEQKRLRSALVEAEERRREMDEDWRLTRRGLEDLQGRLASTKGQLREIDEAQARADAQWEQLENEIAQHRGQLRELDQAPQHQEEVGLTEAIHAAESCIQEAQAELERRREWLVEATQLRASVWAERDGLQRHLQQLLRGAFDLEAERRRLEEDRQSAEDRAESARQRLSQLAEETQAALVERLAQTEQIQALQPQVDEAQELVRVLERQAREYQAALENARQLHQETLIHGAQVQGSMEAVAKEIELALGLEVRDFLNSLTEEEHEAWAQGELVHQTQLAELQGKRLDLGGVNPLAIQELAEAEQRLGFMNQQRGDVLEAIGNLESTIKEINGTSEERFKEAFDFVNARFTEVFREVFGGGTAHLTLQDPKDLLECGIEIMAQPPGKSAKALTLLSGGEKALTAISLLFAIFHFKPSPFCVLDEVDAPLDEANVSRFANLVKKMKEGTQFIVITHQKPTMVAADTLYGVTMEERGISRLVSVHLKEAEQLV